jgi:hypothetical protein
MEFYIAIVIVICFIIFLFIIKSYNNLTEYTEKNTGKKCINSIDGGCYKVLTKYKDYGNASKYLGQLNIFIKKILSHLKTKYVDNIEYIGKRRNQILYLIKNYRSENIIENAPKDTINTSYVENKGEVFALCLRERESGQFDLHSYEDMQFVMLHEIAHLMTKEHSHTDGFWENFKFITIEAEETGLYIPVNYNINPMKYCGVNVTYNPYYDETLIIS